MDTSKLWGNHVISGTLFAEDLSRNCIQDSSLRTLTWISIATSSLNSFAVSHRIHPAYSFWAYQSFFLKLDRFFFYNFRRFGIPFEIQSSQQKGVFHGVTARVPPQIPSRGYPNMLPEFLAHVLAGFIPKMFPKFIQSSFRNFA